MVVRLRQFRGPDKLPFRTRALIVFGLVIASWIIVAWIASALV
jgi:hypothetical protein